MMESKRRLLYWGLGNIGKRILSVYDKILPTAILDSKVNIAVYKNIPVLRPEEIKIWQDYFVVINVADSAEIRVYLEEKGLIEGEDFSVYTDYFNIRDEYLKFYLQSGHWNMEERHINNKNDNIYYIIRYDNYMSCGWTVWERVALYGCIYAEDYGMTPVIDMKNQENIYQDEGDFGKVNTWDEYYEQPCGVSLEEAESSTNYILADPSKEWFIYIRTRKEMSEEFLRRKYNKYIRLRNDVLNICEQRCKDLFPTKKDDVRMFGIVMRGTDYLTHHHYLQPDIFDVVEDAKQKYKEYHCECFYIMTEDFDINKKLRFLLGEYKVISYNAGNIKNIGDGLIGDYLRESVTGREASLDYLTNLYILDRCSCIVGGVCGATIVAKYRRNPPYEYCNIIDMHKSY